MMLDATEQKITGQWTMVDGKVIADENCKRIELLIESTLKLVSEDESGWIKTYLNEEDDSYWKLHYPQCELQGGGPPELIRIND